MGDLTLHVAKMDAESFCSGIDTTPSTVMVHFKSRKFSEELCRPVDFIGGKSELLDKIVMEFSDVLDSPKDNIILQVCIVADSC